MNPSDHQPAPKPSGASGPREGFCETCGRAFAESAEPRAPAACEMCGRPFAEKDKPREPEPWPEPVLVRIHSHFDHVRNELSRVQQMLRRGVMLVRRPEALGSILINDKEAEELARRTDLLNEWPETKPEETELVRLESYISAMRAQIDDLVKAAQQPVSKGARLALPLADLREAHQLTPAEFDILLLAFAASLSADYGSIFGYLQNDGTHTEPSVNLALNLLDGPVEERLARRRFFHASAPLVRHRLIHLAEREKPLLRQHFRLDETIAGLLLGHARPANAAPAADAPDFASVGVDEATEARLRELAARLRGQSDAVVRFIGAPSELVRAAAEAVAAESGRATRIFLDLTAEGTDTAAIEQAVRDARLWKAALIVTGSAARGSVPPAWREAEVTLWRALEGGKGTVFLLGPEGAFGRAPAGIRYWNIEIVRAGFERRARAWERELGPYTGPPIDAAQLAGAFKFSNARIRQAVHFGRGLAAQRGAELHTDDLVEAGRELTVPQIARFARRVKPRAPDWGNLELPPEKMSSFFKSKRACGIATRSSERGALARCSREARD